MVRVYTKFEIVNHNLFDDKSSSVVVDKIINGKVDHKVIEIQVSVHDVNNFGKIKNLI